MNGSCDLYLSRTPDLWINLQEARCCFDCWIPKTKLLTEKSEILQGQHDLKVPHFCVEFSNKQIKVYIRYESPPGPKKMVQNWWFWVVRNGKFDVKLKMMIDWSLKVWGVFLSFLNFGPLPWMVHLFLQVNSQILVLLQQKIPVKTQDLEQYQYPCKAAHHELHWVAGQDLATDYGAPSWPNACYRTIPQEFWIRRAPKTWKHWRLLLGKVTMYLSLWWRPWNWGNLLQENASLWVATSFVGFWEWRDLGKLNQFWPGPSIRVLMKELDRIGSKEDNCIKPASPLRQKPCD